MVRTRQEQARYNSYVRYLKAVGSQEVLCHLARVMEFMADDATHNLEDQLRLLITCSEEYSRDYPTPEQMDAKEVPQ